MLLALALQTAVAQLPSLLHPQPNLCAVGKQVLTKLEGILSENVAPLPVFYLEKDSRILTICPSIRSNLPGRFEKVESSRADILRRLPLYGPGSKNWLVANIGEPTFDSFMDVVAIRMTYTCSGLCGADAVYRFKKRNEDWVLAEVRVYRVS